MKIVVNNQELDLDPTHPKIQDLSKVADSVQLNMTKNGTKWLDFKLNFANLNKSTRDWLIGSGFTIKF